MPMSEPPMYRPHELLSIRHPHPGQELFTGALLQSPHMEGFRKKFRPKRRRKYTKATGNVKNFQKMEAIAIFRHLEDKNLLLFSMPIQLVYGPHCIHRPINGHTLEGGIRSPIRQEEVAGGAFGGSVCSLERENIKRKGAARVEGMSD